MKKIFAALLLVIAFSLNAQVTANRFFYELTFKPGIEIDSLKKEMTILDITKEKSLYRDYLMVSQDSLLKVYMDQAMKSGNFSMKTFRATFKEPKFSYRVSKTYPTMDVKFTEQILQDKVSYDEKLKFDWKIENEKAKIGEYNAQKATTTYGGRNWTAWFSTDLPFQDGPYKFYGLPGLIVKLEDSEKNYSWELKGNKKIDNYEEQSYGEKMQASFGSRGKELTVSKEKFDQIYYNYKQDPYASIRPQLAQIPADMKMPDGTSIAQMMKDEEARLKKFLAENNNSVEKPQPKAKK